MKHFVVVPAGLEPVELQAANWVVALGLVLDQLGKASSLGRLACETLPNGTVIAKDLHGSGRYVIHEQAFFPEETDEFRTLDPDDELEEIDAFEAWLQDIDESASTVFAAQAALAAAQAAVISESGSVLHLDEHGLRFVAASGPVAAELVGRYIPSDAGAAGFSVQHRQVMVLSDVAGSSRHYEEIDKVTGFTTRNLCCVPLVHGETVYGVIEVVNFPDDGTFGTESRERLERVANRLGRRFARGARPRLADATPPEDADDPASLEEVAVEALEPISVNDIALALPPGDISLLDE